jgi:hypothetical protein
MPLLLFAALISGCASDFQRGIEREKYAEVREGADGRIQIILGNDEWMGFFSPEGYGGISHNVYYWATLNGPGPIYLDPDLRENGSNQTKHRGTIKIDRIDRQVVIDLRKISEANEGDANDGSPANGTYPIKKFTKAAFIRPE